MEEREFYQLCDRVTEIFASLDVNSAQTLVGRALDNTPGTMPPVGTLYGKDVMCDQISISGEWKILKWKTQIASSRKNLHILLGPGNKYKWHSQKDNFIKLLKYVDNNAERPFSTIVIYQVVVDDSTPVKENCKKLLLSTAEKQYKNTKNLAAGYYTLHPVDSNALTPVENYFTNLSLDKDNECVVLLGKMGAKSVHISRYNADSTKNNFSGGAKEINVKIGVSILNNLDSDMDFKVSFTGNASRVSPDILRNSVWFKTDPQMNGLLEALQSSNPPKEWDYSEKISSKFNFDFRIAAKILGSVEAELKNEYEKATKTSRRFHVLF